MNQFRKNNTEAFFSLLQGIVSNTKQSRTLLFTGDSGWGKVACALDLAQYILQENPLSSSNFFYFRNDLCTLKTEYFLTKSSISEETWAWLYLLQRRINMIATLDETITMPTGIKLINIKEQLDEIIQTKNIPKDNKFIAQLISFTAVLNKKTGIPINVIREAIKFHSTQSLGRVSILADFDTADTTTQNAALKLIEEPYPHHWVIITAQNTKKILPTILSRTLKIAFKKPVYHELEFLDINPQKLTSSIELMKESLYKLSDIKFNLITEFFTQCTSNIEHGILFIQFSEKLSKNGHSILFLEELSKCMENSLRCRQNKIRNISLELPHPLYAPYSQLFINISTIELEELVIEIEKVFQYITRSVIKDDHLLPTLLLNISRLLRRKN